jgi:hypothetical protein
LEYHRCSKIFGDEDASFPDPGLRKILIFASGYAVPFSLLTLSLKVGAFQSGSAGIDSKEIVPVSPPFNPVGVDPDAALHRNKNELDCKRTFRAHNDDFSQPTLTPDEARLWRW